MCQTQRPPGLSRARESDFGDQCIVVKKTRLEAKDGSAADLGLALHASDDVLERRSTRVRDGRRVESRRAAPLGDKASSEENDSIGTVSPARWLDVDLGTVATQPFAVMRPDHPPGMRQLFQMLLS